VRKFLWNFVLGINNGVVFRFALEGAKWKFIRTKLSPTFTTGKIKSMFGTVVETSESLVKRIDLGKEFETRNLCNRFICDVIGSVAFGLDSQALAKDDCELLAAGEKVFRMDGLATLRFFFVNSFMDLAKTFNMRVMPSDSANFFIATVKEAIKYREENNIHRPDFLNSLIQLKNTGTIDGEKVDNDKKLTFNQIVAEAFLFFFAGFETSATTMSFALYELAANADIQARVRDEVKETLGKYDGKFTYDSIFEMNYLNQVFNGMQSKCCPMVYPNGNYF
jgi:cytochrome P450 family 6